ncbi:MAG: DUF1540 domain-containing protein [Christensenellaceae bacterium]|nr:DUF1540 domain-containing protein [Christensenellaceae bacterium]
MSIKGSQSISCNVNSCAFNQERKCTLKAIVVAPCPHGDSGKPEDESMCASYYKRMS